METKKYANIEVKELTADNPDLTIVMMHGYGADSSDLIPLAEYLIPEKNVRWIFPEGILQVPIGPGWFGRAWFPIDFEAIEKLKRSGGERDLSSAFPQGFAKAREELMKMLAEINPPLDKLVLSGFSQGSMMAVDLTLQLPQPIAGLAILSGTLVNAPEMESTLKLHAGLDFFQCHGSQDPVLPFKMAKRLNTLLNSGSFNGNLIEFPGGHEIPALALQKLNEYLLDRI